MQKGDFLYNRALLASFPVFAIVCVFRLVVHRDRLSRPFDPALRMGSAADERQSKRGECFGIWHSVIYGSGVTSRIYEGASNPAGDYAPAKHTLKDSLRPFRSLTARVSGEDFQLSRWTLEKVVSTIENGAGLPGSILVGVKRGCVRLSSPRQRTARAYGQLRTICHVR